MSNSKRGVFDAKGDVPGPGSYKHSLSWGSKKKPESKFAPPKIIEVV